MHHDPTPELTCHDQAGTAPASPTPSDTSSLETTADAGSADTPEPTASTTSNPPASDPTSNGTPPTGEQHTSPPPATPKAALPPDAPAPATPDEEPTHPTNHPPADGDHRCIRGEALDEAANLLRDVADTYQGEGPAAVRSAAMMLELLARSYRQAAEHVDALVVDALEDER